jgi:hypothetical protein
MCAGVRSGPHHATARPKGSADRLAEQSMEGGYERLLDIMRDAYRLAATGRINGWSFAKCLRRVWAAA